MDATNPLLERLKFVTIVAEQPRRVLHGAGGRRSRTRPRRATPAPDPAGLSPLQQLQLISERAHEMVDRLYATLLRRDPARPRRAGHPHPGGGRPRRAGPGRPLALLPRRDPARPHPHGHRLVAALSHALVAQPQPRRAARPRRGRGPAAPGRGAGAVDAAAPGAASRGRGHELRPRGRRHPDRAAAALPGPARAGVGGLPHRPRRRDGPRRRGRPRLPEGGGGRSCAIAARAIPCASRWRREPATTSCACSRSGWRSTRRRRLPHRGSPRPARPSSPWWSCRPSRTSATRP